MNHMIDGYIIVPKTLQRGSNGFEDTVFPKVLHKTAPNSKQVQTKLPADPHVTICTATNRVTSGRLYNPKQF